MNYYGKIFCLVSVAMATWHCATMTCPYCVGSMNNESAPFFSDECYQSAPIPKDFIIPEANKEEES